MQTTKTHTKNSKSTNLNPVSHILKSKSKKNSSNNPLSEEYQELNGPVHLQKKSSFIFNNPIISQPPLKSDTSKTPTNYKFLRVKSDMENYKALGHQRRVSCPLLVVDQTSDKFNIYDKSFTYNPSAATASGTPNDKKKKRPSDDDQHRSPPEFYPFNELD